MKRKTRLVLIFISVAAVIFGAQFTADGQTSGQGSQVRETWIDPSTALMWAARDNGKDVTWKNAMKYCRELKLGGYSGWRLATIDELKGISIGVEDDFLPPRDGVQVEHVRAGKPKGKLHLSSSQTWSSSKRLDDRGHATGYAWYFDFPHGEPSWDPFGYNAAKRALCVRGPESEPGKK